MRPGRFERATAASAGQRSIPCATREAPEGGPEEIRAGRDEMDRISRGFKARPRTDAPSGRVPPGQYLTSDFPVLSAGPTPRIDLPDWRVSTPGAESGTPAC